MMTSHYPTAAYGDGSALLAIALEEPAGPDMAGRLNGFAILLSSNLPEAELRAAFIREGRVFDYATWLSRVFWVFPNHSLVSEMDESLRVRYFRSGDWQHIAMALYAASTMA